MNGAVLEAFGVAGEHLETALGLDGVRERLRAVGWVSDLEDEELHETLKRLVKWELLDVVHNHAQNYRTAEEYERRNLHYSLTRREAALAGVRHALEVLASTGALQTAVLEAIADRLDELTVLSGEPSAADRRIFSTLRELEGHLEGLVENTKAFNGQLQRLLRAEGVDLDVFREVKAATVAYLQEFLVNLDRRGETVAAAVARVEERGIAVLRERALRGAELPPTSGEDPAAGWLESRRARWAGLRAWFLPDDGARPGSSSCTTSPGAPSSPSCRCWSGSTSPGAAPPAPYRTSGSSRAGSLRLPTRRTCTGCGRPPSASARPAMPTLPTRTRS